MGAIYALTDPMVLRWIADGILVFGCSYLVASFTWRTWRYYRS
jgi:hypothetical protein